MVSSCMLIGGCRVRFLVRGPYCTLDRRRFRLRMIRRLLAPTASCIFPLWLYASLPIFASAYWAHNVRGVAACRCYIMHSVTALAYCAHNVHSVTALSYCAHNVRSVTALTYWAHNVHGVAACRFYLMHSVTALAYSAHDVHSVTALAYSAHNVHSVTSYCAHVMHDVTVFFFFFSFFFQYLVMLLSMRLSDSCNFPLG